jgi:antitoxin component YwqK of YwqJK toxin-antitoxin module
MLQASFSFEGESKIDTVAAKPPLFFVSKEDQLLKNNAGYWMYNKDTLSGFITENYKGFVLSKIPIIKGKEEGWATGWYSGGKKKFKAFYRNGNREYIQKGWFENGAIAYELNFREDLFEGVQRYYYSNGCLKQESCYRNGNEEGVQKVWNSEGRLTYNYTIKNGKLYGVVGRFDCVSTSSVH